MLELRIDDAAQLTCPDQANGGGQILNGQFGKQPGREDNL
jgi:hypothetical protein